MRPLLSRRNLLIASALGVTGAAGAQYVARPMLRPYYQRYLLNQHKNRLINFLTAQTQGLKIDPADIAKYVDEHFKFAGSPYYNRYATEEKILVNFMLSTDFFFNGSDETKPIKYLGYNDPYLRPCYDPFIPFRIPA
jgi:hypothetical protein